jgi:hypothetical protein
VDGSVLERTLAVRLDPRVEISSEDLKLQTDASMACYKGYLKAQALREAMEETPDYGRGDEWKALLGSGTAGDPNILYGSIYETPGDEETIAALQHKFIFLLKLLQEADARPTPQAVKAVEALQESLGALQRRWEALR